MNENILSTIEVLTKKVASKEEEANKLKKLINELCAEEGIEPKYPHVSESAGSSAVMRSDQFYGQTLTAAIRNYLEIRKSGNLGPASPIEIYSAIADGGYKFGTDNLENAKISVSNAIRKSSSIFHRLPNGKYGLLSWYPSAKAVPTPDDVRVKSKTKKREKIDRERTIAPGGAEMVTNKDVREVILAQTGEFTNIEIVTLVKNKFPSKTLAADKVSTGLHNLKAKGLIKVVTERSGKKGAVFAKA